MVAVLHCIITEIENNRIKSKLLIWQQNKNLYKYCNSLFEKIKLFKFFSHKVSLFKDHLNKIEKNGFCWGRNWD